MTNNAIEFRGRYRRIELHPGVVFLLPSVRREGQLRLFAAALDSVLSDPDLVNKALDLSFGEHGEPQVRRYDLPPWRSGGQEVRLSS